MLTYNSYLKIRELLGLQKLLSPEHDEMQFIIVHQVFELWFKLMLHELEAIRNYMLENNIDRCVKGFKRLHEIEKVLFNHFPVIETMSYEDFFRFRSNLAPASGIQSVQFREVKQGKFGETMLVNINNDGPATFILDV